LLLQCCSAGVNSGKTNTSEKQCVHGDVSLPQGRPIPYSSSANEKGFQRYEVKKLK